MLLPALYALKDYSSVFFSFLSSFSLSPSYLSSPFLSRVLIFSYDCVKPARYTERENRGPRPWLSLAQRTFRGGFPDAIFFFFCFPSEISPTERMKISHFRLLGFTLFFSLAGRIYRFFTEREPRRPLRERISLFLAPKKPASKWISVRSSRDPPFLAVA